MRQFNESIEVGNRNLKLRQPKIDTASEKTETFYSRMCLFKMEQEPWAKGN